MSNHLGNANKMVSDTPRTDAHNWLDGDYDDPLDACYDFSCKLERELNAANDEIEEKRKDIVYLATEKAKLENYVMRLEEAGDALANTQTYDLLETVNWRKSKEAKP